MNVNEAVALMNEALAQKGTVVDNLAEWLENSMDWIDDCIRASAADGNNFVKVEIVPERDGDVYRYDDYYYFLSLPLGCLMPRTFHARDDAEQNFMCTLINSIGHIYGDDGYRIGYGRRMREFINRECCYDWHGGYSSPYVTISWG